MNTEPASDRSLAWEHLTWEEIGHHTMSVNDSVLFPIGATEQHGPHLGTGMDTALADVLCRTVSARTGVPMLPALPFGCSLGHSRRWPGTLAVQPQLLIDIIVQVAEWAHASGFRRLFLVNSHVTNAAPLRCALEILRSRHDDLMIALINTATLSPRVQDAFGADAEDWHANAAETSLMLALRPDLVRPDQISKADDPDRTRETVFAHPVNRTSQNGVTGSPSQATATAGQELFDWMVEDLSALVHRGLKERPPLPHSYFEPVTR